MNKETKRAEWEGYVRDTECSGIICSGTVGFDYPFSAKDLIEELINELGTPYPHMRVRVVVERLPD